MSKQSKIIKGLIVYYILISLYLFFLLGNYVYFDFSLVFFLLSFYYFGYILIKEYYNSGIFSIKFIFNVFGFLYTNYHIIELINRDTTINEHLIFMMHLSYIAIFCFNLSYYLTKRPSTQSNNRSINVHNFNWGLLFILIISIAAFYYVVFIRIGFMNYIVVSRAEMSLIRSDYSYLTFYANTLPLVSAVSLFLFYKFKKVNLVIFMVAFAFALFNSIITMSRAGMLAAALPVLYLLNFYKKISQRTTIIVGVLGFMLFGIWKSLFSDAVEVQYGEFTSWYALSQNVLSHPDKYSLLLGKSYLDTLINLIIPVTGIEPLSIWYLRVFEPDVLFAGGGRGFSSVLEAFINLHIPGVVIVYAFYGFIAKRFSPNSDLKILINMIVLVSINMLFRSESYAFWKAMLWLKIYPIVILYYLSSKRIAIKKASI